MLLHAEGTQSRAHDIVVGGCVISLRNAVDVAFVKKTAAEHADRGQSSAGRHGGDSMYACRQEGSGTHNPGIRSSLIFRLLSIACTTSSFHSALISSAQLANTPAVSRSASFLLIIPFSPRVGAAS